MAFGVPNEADVADGAQAQPDAVDWEIIQRAIHGDGVWEVGDDLEVTAQGTPDNTVAVAEGVVKINGELFQVDAANTGAFSVNSGVGDRFDLVVITSAGAIAIREGAEHASNPVFPALTAGDIVLAACLIQSTETADVDVVAGDIIDKRMFVPVEYGNTRVQYAAPQTNEILSMTDWLGNSAIYSSTAQDDDAPYGIPIYLQNEVTVDRIVFHVQTRLDSGADGDSPVIRSALYRAGADNLPEKLIVESSTLVDISDATGSNSTKLAVITSTTLKPGLYFIMLKQENITNSTQQVKLYTAEAPRDAIAHWDDDVSSWGNGTSFSYRIVASDISGAFPDPISAGVNTHTSSAGMTWLFGLRSA